MFIFLCLRPTLSPNSSATLENPCKKKLRNLQIVRQKQSSLHAIKKQDKNKLLTSKICFMLAFSGGLETWSHKSLPDEPMLLRQIAYSIFSRKRWSKLRSH